MIPLKQIKLDFIEGDSKYGNRVFTSFEYFQRHMLTYARSISFGLGGRPWLGYYKADVMVEWADGESWSDRYDMGEFGLNDNRTLAGTIRHYCEFYNGKKPHWMSQPEYDSILVEAKKRGAPEFYQKIVSGYELDSLT